MSSSSSSTISALQEKISASEARICALEKEVDGYSARLKAAPKEEEQGWIKLLTAKSNELTETRRTMNILLEQQHTGPGNYPCKELESGGEQGKKPFRKPLLRTILKLTRARTRYAFRPVNL